MHFLGLCRILKEAVAALLLQRTAPNPWAALRAVCSVVPDAGIQPERYPGLLVAVAGRGCGGQLLAGGVLWWMRGTPRPLSLPVCQDRSRLTLEYTIPRAVHAACACR